EYENFLRGAYFKNTAAAIADVEVRVMIERNSGSDTHAFDKEFSTAGPVDTVNVALKPAGNKKITRQAERQAGGVHDVRYKGCYSAPRRNLVDRYRRFLAAPAAVGGVDIAFAVNCRIRDRVQVRRNLPADLVGEGQARVTVGCDN